MLERQVPWAADHGQQQGTTQPVLVVEDRPRVSWTVGYVCEFLDVPVKRVSSSENLSMLLDFLHPLAVICELEGGIQDGYHIMKLVAAHKPELPLLLVTGGDHALIGAADAIEEIWGLTSVFKVRNSPGPGEVVDFLFRFGRLETLLRKH